MKKIVCEICGSQALKKENGLFICQECGTEYSVEDAKKLLVDIGETKNEDTSKDNIVANEGTKFLLLKKLSLWADYFLKLKEMTPLNHEIVFNDGNIELKRKIFLGKIETADSKFYNNVFANFSYSESRQEEINYISKIVKESSKGKRVLEIFDKCKEQFKSLIAKGYRWTGGENGFLCTDRAPTSQCFGDGLTLFYKSYDIFDFLCRLVSAKDSELDIKEGKQGFFTFHYYPTRFPDLKEAKKNAIELQEDIIKEYNQMNFSDEYNNYIFEKTSLIKSIIETKNSIIEIFNLPCQYQNLESITGLIKIILDGKADTWKEAVVLFDTEQFRQNLLATLGDLTAVLKGSFAIINKNLEAMNMKLSSIDNNLYSISSTLDKTYTKIVEQNNNLKAIRKYSFITMWETL